MVDRNGKLNATVFLLLPEHLDAFWLGRRFDAKTTQTSPSDVRIIARLSGTQNEMFIHFTGPMTGDTVQAQLRFREEDEPQLLTFVRQRPGADNGPLRHPEN